MTLSSQELARFIVDHPVDAASREAAGAAIVDTLAVMLAGAAEPSVVRLASTLLACADGHDSAPSFTGARLRREDAALLYGMAAHILDYDDVSMLAISHPSAPVLAALLAARPWEDISGEALCEALAIGAEVMIRLGQAIGFRHYDIGFHATATLGAFGATAAVARLLRLDVDHTHNSLGVVASLASGLRLNFGSMLKSAHAGMAASNGIRAVAWTRAGVSATSADLFSAGGVIEAFSGGERVRWPSDIVLGAPFAIASPGFEQKRHPCCYMLHKIIAIGRELHDRDGLTLSEIRRIQVEMPVGGTRPLIHPRPRSGMSAMFSGPYAILAAIQDGDVTFASFTDASVLREDIQERLADVDLAEVGNRPLSAEEIGAAPVTISVELRNGRTLSRTRLAAPGSPGDPLSAEDIRLKWLDCLRRAAPRLDPSTAEEAFDQRHCLAADQPMAPWLDALWTMAANPAPQQG